MARREIITYPDPILRKACAPVAEVDEEVVRLIDDLAETMYAAPGGAGLAAPQVGVSKRVIVLDVSHRSGPRELITLVNPEIIESGGEIISVNEGCLSCPEVTIEIPRAEWVKVSGLDREGRPVVVEGDGFLSIVLQHEIDHLSGQLIVDRLSRLKRGLYRRQRLKLKEGT